MLIKKIYLIDVRGADERDTEAEVAEGMNEKNQELAEQMCGMLTDIYKDEGIEGLIRVLGVTNMHVVAEMDGLLIFEGSPIDGASMRIEIRLQGK